MLFLERLDIFFFSGMSHGHETLEHRPTRGRIFRTRSSPSRSTRIAAKQPRLSRAEQRVDEIVDENRPTSRGRRDSDGDQSLAGGRISERRRHRSQVDRRRRRLRGGHHEDVEVPAEGDSF